MVSVIQSKSNGKGFSGLFSRKEETRPLPFTLIEPELGRDASGSSDSAKFRKQLGWLIKEAPPAALMSVTPSMAAVMLERNQSSEWHNRPQAEKSLARLTRDMRDKRFPYTADTVKFSRTGRLLDGQHRLSAIVASGATIPVLVAFGVEDEAFKYMDIGTKRTAAHIFAIEDVPQYAFTSAATRIVHGYLNDQAWDGRPSSIDNADLLDFYWEHPGITDSATIARKFDGVLAPRWAGAIHYLCGTKNKKQADDFFTRIATQTGLSSGSPELLIRRRLDKSARSSADTKDSDTYLAAFLVQAWNAYRKGDKRAALRWRGAQNAHESFPRIV